MTVYHAPVLIGVLIDVSNSMQRSWRNTDGKQLPRIEVVRDVLNKRIREEQRRLAQDSSVNKIELFWFSVKLSERECGRIEED